MIQTCLEITDQEYLIKLPKKDFNITLIHQLLKRIHAEQFVPTSADDESDDIISRNLPMKAELRFDDLRDK